MQFRQDRPQDQKDTAFETFRAETWNFLLDEREACAHRRNDFFSSTQLHAYGVGKMSNS